MQLLLFSYLGFNRYSIKADELIQAYFDCRSNKRRTANAMAFEVDYERKLIQLLEDINPDTYYPGKSIAFIVNRPVKREIFAADFRDRIVHHLIINKLNPLFEKDFIRDCFVLKLDMQPFFMNIKKLLFDKLHSYILEKYQKPDQKIIIDL